MDKRALADNLDRLLDDLATGGTGDPTGVDPEFTRIARRYRALGRSPAPSDVRARVWQGLEARDGAAARPPRMGPAGSNGYTAAEGSMLTLAYPGTHLPATAPRRPAWQSRFVPLAATLVVVLAAAAGYLIFGRDGDDRPRTIPAAVVATPAPDGPVFETVFTTTLPAAELPSDPLSTGMELFTIPVGTRSIWEQPTCCSGPMVEYVVEGSYGVRAEAPIRVVRANGTDEEIAAGTEVVLNAGDALISRNETVVEAWNAGAVPTLLLNWLYIDGGAGHIVSGWQRGPTDVRFGVTLPQGSARVTLLRVTLPNGGEANVGYLDGPQFAVPYGERNGSIGRRTDGSIRFITADPGSPFVAYLLRVEPSATAGAPPAGSPEANPVS